MHVKLTFVLEMRSDYHISAGHGLGAEADSALLRDVDGMPVLRGTTVAGLLRDGLWRLLKLAPMQQLCTCQASGKPAQDADGSVNPAYCGQFEPHAANCPICRLFGTPRNPKRWRIASARPRGKRRIRSGPPLARPERQIVRRVRINPATRRAETRKLFSQEDGGPWSFQFTATCAAHDSDVMDEAALLVAAARFVRQLGRSRRRGQGECLIRLEKAENLRGIPTEGSEAQAMLLDHFEQRWLNGVTGVWQPVSVVDARPETGLATRFRLVIRADEPLLIAQRAEAGNQFESRLAIPGSTVRGAFAWLAARRRGLDPARNPDYRESPAYADFVRVFLRGEVRFPFLYPARYREQHLYPTVPAPLDWLTCKVFPGLALHGVTQAKEMSEQRCQQCGEQVNPLDGFVSLESIRAEYKPVLRHEPHIRIDPDSGRVAHGDLFTYVALEAGQYFVGELTSADDAAWGRFCALTGVTADQPFPLYLGRASRRGYGRTTAWLQPLQPTEEKSSAPLTWIQLPIEERVPESDGILTLTLLTDAIVCDPWGRHPAGFEQRPGWLEEWLKLPVQVVDAFARVRPVDGFNAHLGLPRWRDMALVAGSVAYLKRPEDVAWPDDWRGRLEEAERKGIGLRRNEGFGQIAFNHPLYQPDGTMRGSEIVLPEGLYLVGADLSRTFGEKWQAKLDERESEMARLCADSAFTAVARWLHGRQHEPPATLRDELITLGSPGPGLIEAIDRIRRGEYGDRDKPNRLMEKPERLQAGEMEAQEREKEGLGIVYTLLDELTGEDSSHWPTGIALLAERLAEVAMAKGEQG